MAAIDSENSASLGTKARRALSAVQGPHGDAAQDVVVAGYCPSWPGSNTGVHEGSGYQRAIAFNEADLLAGLPQHHKKYSTLRKQRI